MLELSVGTLRAIFPLRNMALKGSAQMKHRTASITGYRRLPAASTAIAACVLLSSAGVALAQPGTTGQPGTNAGVNCGTTGTFGSAMNTPGFQSTPTGGAASAKGSPFNATLPGKAGTVYANTSNGSPPSANAPNAATSQYDIACFNVTPQVP
jgi:hypothetical protein